MEKGLFITFEGCDGCGKTTCINNVSTILRNCGIEFILTREALLYAASRRQHLVEIILPALKSGKIVLCDRYLDSSLAYQGYARNLGIDNIMSINSFAIENVMPDLTFFLDLSPEEGLKRIQSRKRESDRLDQEKLDFHKRVYEGYQIVNNRFKDRIVRIDASKAPNEIAEEICSILLSRLGYHNG